MTFEARILGPVEASRDGRPVSLGSPKQRAVFALLVLNGGKVVSTDRLVSELWGDDPPSSPVSTLQVYISRLRRSMGTLDGDGGSAGDALPYGSVSLVRRSPGYQLTLPEGAVDADRFRRLVETARSSLADDPVEARRVLEHALALQRGAALADVLELLGPNAAVEAQRLDDLRLSAQQLRLEAMLADGEAAAVAVDAAALVREHPLREGLHGVLMLALYRSGRQSEALQAYEAVRQELDDQLGVDPGPALRELQLQILRQDPALSPTFRERPPAPAERRTDPVLERHENVPARVQGPATGWVPEPLTTLVGREQEIGDVAAALARGRLTSLTGTGGSGKTRLALAVVGLVRAAYPAGLWWVDLSTVTDPDSVARLVASAIGGRELAGRPVLESAAAQVGPGAGLLVLDSCEHLVGASADVAHQLLVQCPGLRVLVTTRTPLEVPGERVWPVEPLAVVPEGTDDLAVIAASQATRLWCERAGAVLPGFELTEENAALVARVCRQLDGLPLAIELAAARLRVLSLEEIADALDHQLEVLAGHDRTAAERHQTLRATLDWSFRLLSADEQQALCALSVFRGGFTVDEAAAVRAAGGAVAPTLDLVSRLIDRSLVTVTDRGRPTRYRLLETVRRYAADALADAGPADAVRARHLGYFVDLAERAEPHLRGADQQEWLGRLDPEVANFVAALRWSLGPGRAAAADGLRLVSALWHFWYLRGHYGAGRQWLDVALEATPDVVSHGRARALAAAGHLAYLQCDYMVSADRFRTARSIFTLLDDRRGVAAVVQGLGSVAREQGDYAGSRALHRESEELWRAADDRDGVARSAGYLGFVAWLDDDPETARDESGRALAFFRTSGDTEGLAWALLVLGGVAAYAGDLTTAEARLGESLRRSRAAAFREGIAWSLNQLGIVAGRRDDRAEARDLQRSSLREHWELGDLWRTASVLEALAGSETRDGQRHWAAHLLGAAEALRSRLGAPVPRVEQPDLVATTERLRADLGAPAFEAALAAGGASGLEQTVRHELVRAG